MAKYLPRSCLKILKIARVCMGVATYVAQCKGPRFNPWYHKGKKKKKTRRGRGRRRERNTSTRSNHQNLQEVHFATADSWWRLMLEFFYQAERWTCAWDRSSQPCILQLWGPQLPLGWCSSPTHTPGTSHPQAQWQPLAVKVPGPWATEGASWHRSVTVCQVLCFNWILR